MHIVRSLHFRPKLNPYLSLRIVKIRHSNHGNQRIEQGAAILSQVASAKINGSRDCVVINGVYSLPCHIKLFPDPLHV